MKHLKPFNESASVKFNSEFIDLIDDICLELSDIDYKIRIKTAKYSLMSTEQSFSILKPGDFVMIDSLKVNVKTTGEFDGAILSSVLEMIKDFSSESGFLVDVYVDIEDMSMSVDDFILTCLSKKNIGDYYFKSYNDITIIIY